MQWDFWNFDFCKHINSIRKYFWFDPRSDDMDGDAVTVADNDLPRALAEACFCQLQIVSASVISGILETLQRVYKCPKSQGWWLVVIWEAWLQFVINCAQRRNKLEIRIRRKKLDEKISISLSFLSYLVAESEMEG